MLKKILVFFLVFNQVKADFLEQVVPVMSVGAMLASYSGGAFLAAKGINKISDKIKDRYPVAAERLKIYAYGRNIPAVCSGLLVWLIVDKLCMVDNTIKNNIIMSTVSPFVCGLIGSEVTIIAALGKMMQLGIKETTSWIQTLRDNSTANQ